MRIDERCKTLCEKEMTSDDVKGFTWMIERDYKVNWMIDSLPALFNRTSINDKYEETSTEIGFPLGFIKVFLM